MPKLLASSCLSLESDSFEASSQVISRVLEELRGEPARVLVVYATVNHDQQQILDRLREALGPQSRIFGCSAQGVVSGDEVAEEGFALAVMGFGGESLGTAQAIEKNIGPTTGWQTGRNLAQSLKSSLGKDPQLIVLHYDPMRGLDVEQVLAGIRSETQCPVVGGGASQPFGPPSGTFQYFDAEVVQGAAVALGFSGPFAVELGLSHGTVPIGITMTVTKSDGPRIFEIDGRPALEVWSEATGYSTTQQLVQAHMASWAVGVERTVPSLEGTEQTVRLIRAARGPDFAAGAMVMQAAMPEGTKILIHHRTVAAVLEGAAQMGRELVEKMSSRRPWAVLGYECRARTAPFLGPDATAQENRALRKAVAPQAPWLGMMAWGEIGPAGAISAFHNYTYPVAALVETSGDV